MNSSLTFEQINKMINNIANDTTDEIIDILTNDLHAKITNILNYKIIKILSNILINLDNDSLIDSSNNISLIDSSNNISLIDSSNNISLIDSSNNSSNNISLIDSSNNISLNDSSNNIPLNDSSNNILLNDSLNNISLNDSSNNISLNDSSNIISLNDSLNDSSNNISLNDSSNNIPLNDSSNNKNATIVTCYYIIPNKYNDNKYNEWIKNFMLLNANRIIYCDKKSHQFMSSLYPEKDNLRYVIKEMDQFYVNKWNWKKEEDIDFEVIRGHNELLYKIWAEKIYFIRDAIKSKIFNNDMYCWMDIGAFRDKNKMNDFNDFPNKKYIVKEKINMLLINKFKDTELQNNIIDDRFKFVNRLSGIFAGDKNILIKMCYLYENMLNDFDRANIFKGKDQTIWNYIYLNNKHLFDITDAIEFNGYDKWYYFHYKWSTSTNESTVKQNNNSAEIVTYNLGKNYTVYTNLINDILLNNNQPNRITRKIIKNGKYDFYIINLLHRKDRYNHIINTFEKYNINLYFIDGFVESIGRIGCNKSHLYAIHYAKKNNMPYIIVVEDDFIFNEKIDVTEFYNILDIISTNCDKYDIFNGSPTFWDQRSSMNNVKKYKSFNDDFNLITNGQKATFVVYTKNMYDIMINNFNPNSELYNDQYTAQHFKQLCYKKYICYELESYSNLQNQITNNTQYIKSQENIYQNLKIEL